MIAKYGIGHCDTVPNLRILSPVNPDQRGALEKEGKKVRPDWRDHVYYSPKQYLTSIAAVAPRLN